MRKILNLRIFFAVLLSMFVLPTGVIGCKEVSTRDTSGLAETESHLQARGKPGLSVKLKKSRPIVLPSIGVANMDLDLVTGSVSGVMEVSASARQGIEILSQNRYTFPLMQGESYSIPLQISASDEGRFYIDLTVTVTNGELQMQRVITAVVQVGAENNMRLQKSGDSMDDSGVIDMPAQETVRPSASSPVR